MRSARSFTLSPRVAFNHDVNGTSPGPGGNFIEGRKSGTLGVEANYLNKWSLDLSYTNYFGGGQFNEISDRDFVAFSGQVFILKHRREGLSMTSVL